MITELRPINEGKPFCVLKESKEKTKPVFQELQSIIDDAIEKIKNIYLESETAKLKSEVAKLKYMQEIYWFYLKNHNHG